ncbi:MAG: septal ring lytic transglycosylase RlpA family protein [Desulfuromonas sp.]|nr:septal ring lytic transglycosylase RlpA family protein [Desulfuromonas sp.]
MKINPAIRSIFFRNLSGAAALLVCVVLLCCAGCADKPRQPSAYEYPSSSSSGAVLKGWQKPYSVMGESYTPLLSHEGFSQDGVASWYGKKFHGRKTSNGEIYDMYAMTAAHKTLPLGVFVRVENRSNGRVAIVRVNDRGPFVAGRIIDLSYAAATKLAVVGPGTAPVTITALGYQQKKADGTLHYTLPESIQSGPFTVQVGAFTQQQNAQRLQLKLQAVYGSAYVRPAQVDGQNFYRVQAGHYTSLPAAQQARDALANSGYGQGFVVAID